jgi:hypothetical protein
MCARERNRTRTPRILELRLQPLGCGPDRLSRLKNEETMSIRNLLIFSLAIAGCAGAAYAVDRYARRLDKRQLRLELRAWEDEGGNLAPSETASDERLAA